MAEKEIKQLAFNQEIGICPDCGYDKGFHSRFISERSNGHVRWILICPDCGGNFDVGLTATLHRQQKGN